MKVRCLENTHVRPERVKVGLFRTRLPSTRVTEFRSEQRIKVERVISVSNGNAVIRTELSGETIIRLARFDSVPRARVNEFQGRDAVRPVSRRSPKSSLIDAFIIRQRDSRFYAERD